MFRDCYTKSQTEMYLQILLRLWANKLNILPQHGETPTITVLGSEADKVAVLVEKCFGSPPCYIPVVALVCTHCAGILQVCVIGGSNCINSRVVYNQTHRSVGMQLHISSWENRSLPSTRFPVHYSDLLHNWCFFFLFFLFFSNVAKKKLTFICFTVFSDATKLQKQRTNFILLSCKEFILVRKVV